MKLNEVDAHLATLDTPDKVKEFAFNLPDIEDVDDYFKGRTTNMSKNPRLVLFDEMLHSEKVAKCWIEKYTDWSKKAAQRLKDKIDPKEMTANMLVQMLGGTMPAKPIDFDYRDFEECMKALRVAGFMEAKLNYEIQARLGYDNYYETSNDGKIYAPADVRTTLYSIAQAL